MSQCAEPVQLELYGRLLSHIAIHYICVFAHPQEKQLDGCFLSAVL